MRRRRRYKRPPEGPQAPKDVQIEMEIGPSKDVKRVNSPTQLLAQQMKPPDTWAAMKNRQTATVQTAEKFVLPPGPELNLVCQAFMKTLNSSIKVVDVQRIQNLSLWRQYATKRWEVVSREGPLSRDRNEKVWLFHGAKEDAVEKIIQQGFNRSFAGSSNATYYGKGVYFARDASCKAAHRMLPIEHSPFATCQATLSSILSSISRSADSASTTYSKPNTQSVQHMLLCRVVTGEFGLGVPDALAPPARTGVILFDSTVNNLADPTIFVTYHDAQAYPEYLIRFRH
jgi:poly [ADP-ribose] polymerase 10/14/15